VADALALPVDVLVTRKIGCPFQPELGVGAIAEGGEPVYDEVLLSKLGLTRPDLRPVAERERAELHRRVRVYRGGEPPPDVAGRPVILVDDGLATGVTARAALRSLRARSAGHTVLAIPVAAPASMAALSGEADGLIALATPATFRAVGEWYSSFGQLTDSDVLNLLGRTPDV
jgi:putative phosphoribosyl transferase